MTVLNRIKTAIKRSPRLRLLHPRRTVHAYCLGAPKTGTTSIASMLRSRYRSEHEPLYAGTIEGVLRRHRGEGTRSEHRQFLIERDRELLLDMESSHPMTVFAGLLAETFPDAKFILTYRDPLAWLRSIIDMRVTKAIHRFDTKSPTLKAQFFRELNERYFRSEYTVHSRAERVLADLGLFTLDGYLSGWARYHREVLDHVPAERLLVFPLDRLSSEPGRIAGFLGIPLSTFDLQFSHSNRAPTTVGVVDRLDASLVQEKIELHCTDVQNILLTRIAAAVR